MKSISFILISFYFVQAFSASIPSYFKLCKRNDPNFEKCALEHAKEIIPYLVEGDKEFNVPYMKPLRLPFVALESSKNFNFNFTDLDIYGLETSVPMGVKYDFDKKMGEITIFIPKIEMRGIYKVDGKILILPIKGSGPGRITFRDGTYVYKYSYEYFEKDGKNFAKIKDSKVSFSMKNAEFYMDNLFNGDKKLGGEMNNFLNENWKDVMLDFGPIIGQTVGNVCNRISNGFFNKVPFDDLFL